MPFNTTIGIHGGEVQSAVQAAGQLGDVHVEGELVAEEVKCLVFLVAGVHKIQPGANVRTSDELKGKGIAACAHTVGAAVISAIKGAVCGTVLVAWAELLVPLLDIMLISLDFLFGIF